MANLDFIFEDKKHTEETMVNDISSIIDVINYLGKKVKIYIKHFMLNLCGILICYLFSISSVVIILFSIALVTSILLLNANYRKRQEKIGMYWHLIWDYKKRKILTKIPFLIYLITHLIIWKVFSDRLLNKKEIEKDNLEMSFVISELNVFLKQKKV